MGQESNSTWVSVAECAGMSATEVSRTLAHIVRQGWHGEKRQLLEKLLNIL